MERFDFITAATITVGINTRWRNIVLSHQTGFLSGQNLSLARQMTCLLTKIICRIEMYVYGLGSRDDTVVTVLTSHRCGPGSIPAPGVTCGLSLLLVLVPAPRVFLRVLRFSSLHKNQHSKIQFDLETVDEEPLRGCATVTAKFYLVYLFYLFNIWNCFWCGGKFEGCSFREMLSPLS